MMTATRFSRFRRVLLGTAVESKESSWFDRLGSVLGISTSATAAPELSADAKMLAKYTVFKGKAALSMSPVLPTMRKLDSGAYKVDKTGVLMMTFWPAIGIRKYDWQKKQMFALSPTEVGSLISLGPAESCEFFHDPSMKSSLEGQVKKTLSIAPHPSDNGYFLNLSVLNTIQRTNERFSVPITKAEFTVMRTVLSYALPHIMGWSLALRPQQQSTAGKPRKQQMEERPDPEFEWGR